MIAGVAQLAGVSWLCRHNHNPQFKCCSRDTFQTLQGDNVASWEELYHSIAGVLNNNMWGVAMAGADICGFYDMAPEHHVWSAKHALPEAEYEELCNRWVEFAT
jgi:alpha-glucosidase (family GH31 glycosyl hydrolase)